MEREPNLDQLVAIMDRLRGDDGCPWDREQTFSTLRGYLLEEAYEVVDALDNEDLDELREELGDLLFQIVFLARLARERDGGGMREVLRGITAKMIRRHPHVFGDASAADSDEVLQRWEQIKREEKGGAAQVSDGHSVLDGLPRALPALQRAQRLGEKAARVGFDWDGPEPVLSKIEEEWGELRQAVAQGDQAAMRDELGDVLFALTMLARHLGLDPEQALDSTNRRFYRRFRWIEARLGADRRDVTDADLAELDRLWSAAKAAESAED